MIAPAALTSTNQEEKREIECKWQQLERGGNSSSGGDEHKLECENETNVGHNSPNGAAKAPVAAISTNCRREKSRSSVGDNSPNGAVITPAGAMSTIQNEKLNNMCR